MQIRVMWIVVAVAALTAACGDSKSSLMPTAPSALSAEATSVDAGAEGEYGTTANGPKPGNGNGNGNGRGNGDDRGGNGKGNGNGNGNQPRRPTNTSPNPTGPMPPGKSRVEFEGLIQAVSSGSILVHGQVIMVTTDTVIRHGNRPFELSQLNEGDRVHVRADRVAAPAAAAGEVATATLEATLILLQNPDKTGDAGETDGLVSVTVFDINATETPVSTGAFRLTRIGTAAQLALPLTVSYALTGTATNGSDYTAPLSATFLAGATTVDVVITPRADAVTERPETVVLTLTGVAPYDFGSPVAGTLTITDAPQVSVIASDDSASEAGDPGRFVLTRTGDFAAPLTVTVALTGTATNGTDYETLTTTVTFDALSGAAIVDVKPLNDALPDGSETVTLTVVDAAAYDLGTTSSATITITGS